MDMKVIPLHELQTDTEGYLQRCLDSGQAFVVELPDRRLVAIQPLEEEDDLVNEQLIEQDPAFQALLAKAASSPRKPFPVQTLPPTTDDNEAKP